jgi:hypothetical protein
MKRANAKTYCIVNIEDLSLIDFNEVFQTSAQTIRTSLNGTLFVIKYDVEPTFIKDGTVTPSQILTHSECLELMSTSAWSEPIEEEVR